MSSPPFVAVELKNTHHVLGVLSRDADSTGGGDLALLAPVGQTVRAPQEFATTDTPPHTAFLVQVPSAQLSAVVVRNSTAAQRRQVFSNPLICVIADDGSAAPVALGSADPTLTLKASNGVVATFDLDIKATAGTDGIPFSVFIQEAAPQQGAPPFLRITEGKVAAGQSGATNVQITLVPGTNAPVSPIPSGTDVHIMVAIAGRPLRLYSDSTP